MAIVGQIADALDAAHAAGVIHREVCSRNILVTDDDGAYLLGLPNTSDIYGGESGPLSPPADFGYTAPERFTDAEVTSGAAIYSLACVLYECLTGEQPFPRASHTIEALIMAHLNKAPPKPSDAKPVVPQRLTRSSPAGWRKTLRTATQPPPSWPRRPATPWIPPWVAPSRFRRQICRPAHCHPQSGRPRNPRLRHHAAPQVVACKTCGGSLAENAGETRPGDGICGTCKRGALPHQLVQRLAGNPDQPLTIAGYTLLEELDQGRLGPLFRARQPDGELCALKVVPTSAMSPDERIKPWPLAQVRTLRHRNIVALRDITPIGEFFLVASEYCPGDTLEGLIRRIGPLTVDQAVPLALQCLDALRYAHTIARNDGVTGVVHCDLKPANILLTRSGGDPITKLADFGLALNAEHTSQDLAFVPRPRVVEPRRAPTRDGDVWSVGACLYYMLTGFGPRQSPSRPDTADVVINTMAMPIRRRNPSIPPRLAAVIDEALVDKPHIHSGAAGDFASALRNATSAARR